MKFFYQKPVIYQKNSDSSICKPKCQEKTGVTACKTPIIRVSLVILLLLVALVRNDAFVKSE